MAGQNIQNPTPKLVLMAGFPGSGKTRISRYLARKANIPRLSADGMRNMMFDKRYSPSLVKDLGLSQRYATTEKEEDAVWWSVYGLEMAYIRDGLGAIIDYSAPKNSGRAWLFNTKDLEADKYLFVVQVDEKVLRIEREHPESVDIWKRAWEEPDNQGYQTVVLENNTKWDYRRNLRKAFKILTGETNPKKWREKIEAKPIEGG